VVEHHSNIEDVTIAIIEMEWNFIALVD
jgi:hypothetical protein